MFSSSYKMGYTFIYTSVQKLREIFWAEYDYFWEFVKKIFWLVKFSIFFFFSFQKFDESCREAKLHGNWLDRFHFRLNDGITSSGGSYIFFMTIEAELFEYRHVFIKKLQVTNDLRVIAWTWNWVHTIYPVHIIVKNTSFRIDWDMDFWISKKL